jgi:hypothetical protein
MNLSPANCPQLHQRARAVESAHFPKAQPRRCRYPYCLGDAAQNEPHPTRRRPRDSNSRAAVAASSDSNQINQRRIPRGAQSGSASSRPDCFFLRRRFLVGGVSDADPVPHRTCGGHFRRMYRSNRLESGATSFRHNPAPVRITAFSTILAVAPQKCTRRALPARSSRSPPPVSPTNPDRVRI